MIQESNTSLGTTSKQMHKNILTPEQLDLLPLVNSFQSQFGLVGGTAIALQIGHRRSIDFDLFTNKKFTNEAVRKKIKKTNVTIEHVLRDQMDDYTIVVNAVKCTFFYYPFTIRFSKKMGGGVCSPDLKTLAAMKAYALGRRAKWKDYVDLYFILSHYHKIDTVVKKAKHIFGSEFNEKNFRVALSYFKDIDYSEQVVYLPGMSVLDSVIKRELTKISTRD